MTDPVFDLNFLGGSGSSSSSTTNLTLHSALDQYSLLSNTGLEGLTGTTSSIFAPLTTSTSGLDGLGGSGGSIFAPLTTQQSSIFAPLSTSSTSAAEPGLSKSSSVTDYSSHYSVEYAQNTHQDTSTTDLATTTTESAQYSNSQHNNTQDQTEAPPASEGQAADGPVQALDIVINNVVCSFSTRCHLNLKKIAREAMHVIYKPENGMVSMKIRKPYTTANIWSSGKITVTGANSEDDAKKAARRYARILQKLGFRVRFSNYRVVNVLGTCAFPFGIRITHLSRDHSDKCSYEPELHPGATYVIKDPKATMKVFSTGSITITAPRVENVQLAIQHIWPVAYQYRMDDTKEPRAMASSSQVFTMAGNNTRVSQYRKRKRPSRGPRNKIHYYVEDSDGELWSDTTDEELDSDDMEEND